MFNFVYKFLKSFRTLSLPLYMLKTITFSTLRYRYKQIDIEEKKINDPMIK